MAAPTTNSVTLTTPAHAAGDLFVVALLRDWAPGGGAGGAAFTGVDPITPPAGWTLHVPEGVGTDLVMGDLGSGVEAQQLTCWTKVAGGAEPANFTWTWVDACGVAAFLKVFTAVSTTAAVNVAAAAILTTPGAGPNPISVSAPSVTPTQDDTTLFCIYAGRNGALAAGTVWTVPPGMANAVPAIQLIQTLAVVNPIGLAAFVESIPAAAAPTGVRISTMSQSTAPPNLFTAIGYSLCIGGICT